MTRNKFIEIMGRPISENVPFLVGFRILQKYSNITFLNDDETDVLYYQVDVDSLFDKISEDDLISIRNSGWIINGDNKHIVKFL